MSILSSVAPILIFSIPFDADSLDPVYNALSGLPITQGLASAVGIPIPIYLDEQLTGIYVNSENKNVDIATEGLDKQNSTKPTMKQTSVSNTVSVNMVGKKDSIFLAALLALVDLAYPALAKAKYRVSYLNGSTVVLGGLIQGISAQSREDNDLVDISLVIHKADSLGQDVPTTPSVPALPGESLSTLTPPSVGG